MKKAIDYKWLILPCLFIFIACEDTGFLNKAPLSTTSPDNYYKTLKDFETALVGCYDAINMRSLSGDNISEGTYNIGLQYMLSGGTDELVLNPDGGGQDREEFGIASYTAVNTAVGDLWKAYYAGIQRCNFLLDKASEVSFESEAEAARLKEVIGEARFLRGFFYWHLAALFGAVPLNTTSSPDGAAARESLERIYSELILPDLQLAYETLPETAAKGGADKWAAAGYLGVIYNYLAAVKRNNVGGELGFALNSFDWVNAGEMSSKAATVLEDVVNNSPYHLIERYDYLFRETTKSHQHEECLFLAENGLEITDDFAPSIAYLFCPGGNPRVYGGSWGTYRPTAELFLSYNDSLDIRRWHNITTIYNPRSELENIEGVNYYVPIPSTVPAFWRNRTGKYRHMDPAEKVIPPASSGISIPLLRYADILLQYAEALYFMGDEASARGYITQVRERAVVDSATVAELDAAYYKEDFIEELLDERKRELCYESKRRLDLIRFGKMEEAINSLDPDAGPSNTRVADLQGNWQDFKIWFPIPQREMDLNKNLVQNVGY